MTGGLFYKKLFVAGLFVLFVILAANYVQWAFPRQCSDFGVTYATAQRFAAKEDLYTKFEDPTIANFKYSPMFAFLTMPLSFVTLHQAAFIFFTVNFFLLLALFALSKALIVKEPLDFYKSFFLYSVPFIFTFRFILALLRQGQVNILMLALTAGALYFLRKKNEVLAGALLALAGMIKYTPYIFLPYFFFKKQWKMLFFSLSFIAFYCLAPAFYVGLPKAAAYLKGWFPFVIHTSLDQGSLCDFKNQSLYSLILRYFMKGTYFGDKIALAHLTFQQGILICLAISALVYLLILWPARRSGKDAFWLESVDYAALFICVALFNANAWMFNYIVFFFAYMSLFYYLIQDRFRDKITLSLTLAAFVLSNVGSQSLVGQGVQNWFETLSFLPLTALLLLFTLFRLKFKRSGAVRGHV